MSNQKPERHVPAMEVTTLEAGASPAPAIVLSPRPPPLSPDADVIVVGGGPAGLSAALVLARSMRSVIILDAGAKRNAAAYTQHAVLGADGEDRRAFLDRALQQVLKYPTVTYHPAIAAVDVRLHAAPSVNGNTTLGPPQRTWLFEIRAQSCPKAANTCPSKDEKIFRSRKLVLATGVQDAVPDVPGMARYMGRGVGVCLYCDAYERRGQYMAAYGRGARGVHLALEMTLWSPGRVVLLTHGVALAATPPEREALAARCVEVVEAPILRVFGDDSDDEDEDEDEEESFGGGKNEKIEKKADNCVSKLKEEEEGHARGNMRGVELVGGRRLHVTALFFNTGRRQSSSLPAALGLETNERGDLKCCDGGGVGCMPGLYAAGNCAAAPLKLVATAASQGAITGARINSELLYEDLGMDEQGGWLDEDEREDEGDRVVAPAAQAGERKDLAELLEGIAAAWKAEE